MATMEEYAKQPVADRMKRLERTPDQLAEATRGRSDAALSRRPDATNWAAKEVVCHLRDIEEFFMGRLASLMAMDDPKFLPVAPDRWAEERQYLRNDTGAALEAFRKRRQESLAFFATLTAEQWRRGGIHPTRGRMTADDILALLAHHDDIHLDQLARALEGRA
jgi:uncharacterized damage-inducible protein DinB